MKAHNKDQLIIKMIKAIGILPLKTLMGASYVPAIDWEQLIVVVAAMNRQENVSVKPMLPEWETVTSASQSIMDYLNQIQKDVGHVTVILEVLTTINVMLLQDNVCADQT